MTFVGIAALVLYVIGFLRGFLTTVHWVAVDEARHAEAGNRTSPDWLNAVTGIMGGLFWPVLALCWLLGWLYRFAAERVG